MAWFAHENSIVRKIWGRHDTVLLIFAGSAAEFALNKAVDWLYFTGRLPSDPLGRLFSTVTYARNIVFAENQRALSVIDAMRNIHKQVESNRNATIPDWAYRDVLYMLIYYSIASYETLERKLTASEKEEVYDVFYRVGDRMGLKELPKTYSLWLLSREHHLVHDLAVSQYTTDLFRQYKKHLGALRYKILIESQKLVVPGRVYALLSFRPAKYLKPMIPLYRLIKKSNFDWLLFSKILPSNYREQIKALNVVSKSTS
ncbi:MAG TPA: oxygenase MpaB family protein [Chryseosolibacter sp.]